ncbi:MAG TPA: VWA domain-containing protein [Chloroflexota bacterium]|nr:VWA domain-containing protein [Chloroflexota bacterium]
MRVLSRALVILLPVVAVGLASSGTSASPDGLDVSVQRIDAAGFPTVVTYAGAVDERGLPVANLDSSAFKVTEDGQPVDNVQVAAVANTQIPVAVGLVIDISGSMNDAGKLAAAKQAAGGFVDGLGPADSAAVISFGTQATVVQAFSADPSALHAALDGLQAQGNTALYDAVQQTALLLDALPQPRRVLVVVTDGMDTASQATLKDAVAAATAVRGVIMPIGVGADVDRAVLDQLAGSTGGTALYPATADEIAPSFRSVLGQLRLSYALAYTSRRPANDQSHEVSVRVAYAGLVAQGVSTYVAKRPPPVGVSIAGLSDGDSVSSPRQIDVQVQSGVVQRLDLLVDGREIATSVGQVTSLTSQVPALPPGAHEVVVRVTDGTGGVTNQSLRVAVAAPILTPLPTPIALPVPDRTPSTDPSLLVLAVVALVLLALGLGVGMYWVRRRPPAAAAAAALADDERTLDLDSPVEPTAVPLSNSRLQVLHGAEMHEIALTGSELMIGRDPTNAITLEDLQVSRKHARIVRDDDGTYWIEDLHSRNGTVLNEHLPILRHRLLAGDRITIGMTTLIFLQGSPTDGSGSVPALVGTRNGTTRT